MLHTVDGARYAKIPWKDLLYLDETSPTGLRWKKDSGANGVKADSPAGTVNVVAAKPKRNRRPYTQMYVMYKGKRYSSRVIVKILKDEPLPLKVVVNPRMFNEHNSKWIQENPKVVWARITRLLHSPSINARLSYNNLLDDSGNCDPDFLQDVFSDACRSFNRSFRKELGYRETTFMWSCVKTAVKKNLDTIATRNSYVRVAVPDSDDLTPADYAPAREVGVNRYIEDEYKQHLLQSVKATASAIFQRSPKRGKLAEKVFHLLMKGMTLREVAKRLSISYELVRSYRDWYTKMIRKELVTVKGMTYESD